MAHRVTAWKVGGDGFMWISKQMGSFCCCDASVQCLWYVYYVWQLICIQTTHNNYLLSRILYYKEVSWKTERSFWPYPLSNWYRDIKSCFDKMVRPRPVSGFAGDSSVLLGLKKIYCLFFRVPVAMCRLRIRFANINQCRQAFLLGLGVCSAI